MAVLSLKCYLNDKVVWLRGLRGVILYTFTRLHTEFGTLAFGLHRPRVAATLARARAHHMHPSLCASVGLYIQLHITISVYTRIAAHRRTRLPILPRGFLDLAAGSKSRTVASCTREIQQSTRNVSRLLTLKLRTRDRYNFGY